MEPRQGLGEVVEIRAADPPEEAIPRLLEQYGGQLYSLGLRLTNDPEDARDLVQETFLHAYRRWSQFEGRSGPGSWLFTIAVRACQRMHRKRAGEPTKIGSLEELLPFGDPTLGVVPVEEGLTAELRREARERVQESIATLPLMFRMPLILKEIIGLSLDEVALVLGLKVATVKTRLHRARLRIRHSMEKALPRAELPPPIYSRSVCLDLLRAKQEALDRGVPFPVADDVVCDRCVAVFQTMDLAREVCTEIGKGGMPTELQTELLREIPD